MVSIVSDDLHVERSLRKSLTLAKKAGASLCDDALIKCIDGSLSIEAPSNGTDKDLILLPWDCLLPVELFELANANDDIVISCREKTLTRECVAHLDALIELYNITGKLAHHRRTSPWALIASQPELMEYIAQRLADDLSALFNRFVVSGDADKLILDTFLHSRTLDYRENENLPPFPVLMPIIDFLNHHLQGAPVQLEKNRGDSAFLTIKKSPPIVGRGNECFVFYGLYDNFDIWMSYGFIDETVPFIRSIPMKINLPHLGTLHLANFVKIRPYEDLPPSMQDLHLFVPKQLAAKRDYFVVTSMLLPPPHMPEALRRTLYFLINEMSPGHPQPRDLVMSAEDQIISANRAYYANLRTILRSLRLKNIRQTRILDDFVHMCDLQLNHIENYARCARG